MIQHTSSAFIFVSAILGLALAATTTSIADESAATCSLTLELVDAESGRAVSGLVQLLDHEDQRVELAELLDRGLGLPDNQPIHDWFVLPGTTVVKVPQGKLTLRGFSGLETSISQLELDLSHQESAHAKLPLTRFYPARRLGWQAANTHVHLKKTSRAQTDRYLIECSKADGLDVVFVSYLERPSEHVHYSTNNYTRGQLQALSNAHTRFDHGQEHRHNFSPWEEGYGHVMLLNIPELIKPVSIGPGITDQGTDGRPLRVGIDKALENDGRVIWCHNAWGLEDIPSWLAGRLDANNIFDGGTHGSYEHSFYRYLNIGLAVPFSTGTDWFMYDFSRVYVKSEKPLSPEDWLDHLAEGRSYISNGPLLEFSVAGKSLGEHVSLAEPGQIRVTGLAVARNDFEQLELVINGSVHSRIDTREIDGHHRADLDLEVTVDGPAWIALRTPPPSSPTVGLLKQTPANEYGGEMFSHTSAIFVDVAGKRVFNHDVAAEMLAELERNRAFVSERGKFADQHEREHVLQVYDEAIDILQARME
jgi:hypothetical protein